MKYYNQINIDNIIADISFFKELDQIKRLIIDVFTNEYLSFFIKPSKNNDKMKIYNKYNYKFIKENKRKKIELEEENIIKIMMFTINTINKKSKNENVYFLKKIIYILIHNKKIEILKISIIKFLNIMSNKKILNELKYCYSSNKNMNLIINIIHKVLIIIFNFSLNINDLLVSKSNIIS